MFSGRGFLDATEINALIDQVVGGLESFSQVRDCCFNVLTASLVLGPPIGEADLTQIGPANFSRPGVDVAGGNTSFGCHKVRDPIGFLVIHTGCRFLSLGAGCRHISKG